MGAKAQLLAERACSHGAPVVPLNSSALFKSCIRDLTRSQPCREPPPIEKVGMELRNLRRATRRIRHALLAAILLGAAAPGPGELAPGTPAPEFPANAIWLG